MADNDRYDTTTGGTELFYRDKNSKNQDAALHAEILGDDTMPWDLDLEAFAEMAPDEQAIYVRKFDDAMIGKQAGPVLVGAVAGESATAADEIDAGGRRALRVFLAKILGS
jgi:hypothetical protein